jgi:putative heme transporter
VQISAFTAVSNLVVAVIKVLIALAGVVVLLASSSVTGLHVPVPHLGSTGIAVAVAVVTAVTAIARVTWRSKPAVAGRAAVRLSASEAWLAVRTGWRAMLLGGLGYPALQALLLWLCLQSMGANVTVLTVLLTYAVERLLTLVPFTPGGVGVVETGASAVLVAFGVDPAAAVAGFLLFRVFSYLIEIPVGGLITACWLVRRRVRPS